MFENQGLKCKNCGEQYQFLELYKIIKRDYKLCPHCLEQFMINGEIPPFTDEEMSKITNAMLEDTVSWNNEESIKEYNRSETSISEHLPNSEGEYGSQTKQTGLTPAPSTKFKNLLKFGSSVNQKVIQKKFDIVGREEEVEEIMIILSRKYKSNPLLVGDPGVGKTAIVEGIASKIVKGEVPDFLKGKEIIEVSAGSLIAGTKFRGEFEERLEKLLKEVVKREDVILFIDEFHSLMNAGGSVDGAVDAISILKPYLARDEIKVIGATTYEEYRKHVMVDKALNRRMQKVDIKEPSKEETVKIIQGIKGQLEEHHRVKIEDSLVEEVVELSNRYLPYRKQPDKTIDLLDEASSYRNLTRQGKDEKLTELESMLEKTVKLKNRFILEDRLEEAKQELENELKLKEKIKERNLYVKKKKEVNSKITGDIVSLIIERKTGIPVVNQEREKLANLEDNLKERIKGQDFAIEEVSRFVKRSKLKMGDPNRPVGVFLFLGPTGVGKTELAKVLSKELFGSESFMTRFDMSEYMEKNSANKLIGSPPGYVGYEEGGKLTNILRRDPYSVVLFDEVEKAHPDVMNVMLQLFEDGLITDGHGNTIDAKNAIFILTSNAGSDVYYKEELGFTTGESSENMEDMKERTLSLIREQKIFRPEFLNRIDSTVVFNPLSKKILAEIVKLITEDVSHRLKGQGYEIDFTEDVINKIVEDGYNPEYGAREFKRKVENIVDLMVDKHLEKGQNKFKVVVEDEKIILI